MKYFDQTLPCPFCGKKEFGVMSETLGPGRMEKDTPCSTMKRVRLFCNHCGAQGPTATIDAVYEEESEAASVERWNQRKYINKEEK